MEKQLCTYALKEILEEHTDHSKTIRAKQIMDILEHVYDMRMQNFRLLGQRLRFNWGAVLFLLGHLMPRFFMLSLQGKRRIPPVLNQHTIAMQGLLISLYS